MGRSGPPLRLAAMPLALGAGMLWAFSHGPEPSRTGAHAVAGVIGEGLCTGCHATNPANNGGKVEVLGVPATYFPDSTYRLTVRLTSTRTALAANRKWGFQLTAVRGDDGQGAGTFELVDAVETQIVPGDTEPWTSRAYVEHTLAGTHAGQASPSEWAVAWRAPGDAVARIFFFVAGNAANGDGNNTGDWIYSGRDTVELDPTPAAPSSWGAVKARWRR